MKWFYGLIGLMTLIVSTTRSEAAEQTISISKVESATILSVRRLSEDELRRDQSRGWALFGDAMIGGTLGFQHGGGSATNVKQVLNSVLRHNTQKISLGNELKSEEKIGLFEIQIATSDGLRKTIVLSNRNNAVYRASDKIRIVHFETGVFIDKIL